MTDMTDLEMIKKCAEKMGEDVVDDGESCRFYDSAGFEYGLSYDPLTNDAQAFALVKHFGLWIEANDDGSKPIWVVTGDRVRGQNERVLTIASSPYFQCPQAFG